jgi:hypothetical protein
MNKKDYILRSLQKIAHKKWELFIISRIIHRLDDGEIEFVTQQFVRRPDGSRAMTDLYFPQFSLHLEIDEPAHEKQVPADFARQRDIIDQTNHSFRRIKISTDHDTKSGGVLEEVAAKVDSFVNEIRVLKKKGIEAGTFTPWDFEKRYSSEPIIEKGYISTDDNVVFRTQVEALRCFGFEGKAWMKGKWPVPSMGEEFESEVWFPRLYEHGIWENSLENEGTLIREVAKTEEAERSIAKQRLSIERSPGKRFIVFAKARDALNLNLLRYVGTFIIKTDSSDRKILEFERVATVESVRGV